MARRRSLNGDDEPMLSQELTGQSDDTSAFASDGSFSSPELDSGEGFGTDLSLGDMGAVQGEESTGSTMRPREIFGSHQPRSFTPGGGAPAAGGDVSQMLSLLPQGVEAAPEPEQSFAAPMQSSEPQSVSLRQQPPSNASDILIDAPPAISSPVNLFSSRGGTGLAGNAGGLFGGGLSMPGGPSGSARPTEQMLSLLRNLLGDA